jgi:hypothetical protein
MSTKKKLLQAAAGSAGGAGGLNVEEVFSTYLYDGNGSAQVIENGINLGQSHGGGSINVPRGEDNNVTTSTNSGFAYGTGDFTWETWIMPQVDDGTLNTTNRYIFDHTDGSGGNLGGASYYNGKLRYYNPTVGPQDSTQALSNYTWAHIAVCRSSGTTKMFYNGTQILSLSDSYNFAEDQFVIGDFGGSGGTYSFGGLYSDVRVSNTARYTSNFTPPSSSFSSDSNTVLLTGQGSTIVDNSSNALTLTANGDAVGKSYGYYDAADAGEGGLVWIKNRTGENHGLVDTEVNGLLFSNLTNAANTGVTHTFNSNGFTVGSSGAMNDSPDAHASWTFRKAPKFFDVVTYTGTGSAQNISHNLGSVPGFIIVKSTTNTYAWFCYHRSLGATQGMRLDDTQAASTSSGYWNNTSPTSTEFTVGTSLAFNASGASYVAYLFAHNDGDGEFGSTADQDIIKCGSYTGNGSSTGPSINLGFEPQWLLIKGTSSTDSWAIFDVMRGMTVGASDSYLFPNSSGAELSYSSIVKPTPTGFQLESVNWNTNSNNYIYIAIRRGPMAVPESATDVFNVQYRNQGSSGYQGYLGNPVDLWITRNKDNVQSWFVRDRFRGGNYINTDSTAAETSQTLDWSDNNVGANEVATTNTSIFSWIWRRAPSFCDVVAYTGNGTAGRTVSHNLGVAPEMMWVKARTGSGREWTVWHKDTGGNG